MRTRVGESQYALAALAGMAFRQPTPEALDALCRADTAALPYLAAALGPFLQEYPWTRDALSRTERRLWSSRREEIDSVGGIAPYARR
jgi:hypothetical protein